MFSSYRCWIEQSAIDLAAYQLGMTDKFKGTGVWNQVELIRDVEPQPGDEKPKTAGKSAAKDSQEKKEGKATTGKR